MSVDDHLKSSELYNPQNNAPDALSREGEITSKASVTLSLLGVQGLNLDASASIGLIKVGLAPKLLSYPTTSVTNKPNQLNLLYFPKNVHRLTHISRRRRVTHFGYSCVKGEQNSPRPQKKAAGIFVVSGEKQERAA